MLLFNTVMAASAQAFTLARSLGALRSVDQLTFSHVAFVVTGIFMMLVGNMPPKMPWLAQHFRPHGPNANFGPAGRDLFSGPTLGPYRNCRLPKHVRDGFTFGSGNSRNCPL
jgi:hypothetical protein